MNEQNIVDLLKTLVKEESVDEWLDTPNPSFDSKKPRDMIDTDDEHLLREMIFRLQSGMPG